MAKGTKFSTAMDKVIDGAKVTRLEWDNSDVYVWLDGDSFLKIILENGDVHTLLLRKDDMVAKDWVVV